MQYLLIFFLILQLFEYIFALNDTFTAKIQCINRYGCHKDFCWTGCSGAFSIIHGPEWYYTKNPLLNAYQTCTSNNQCDGCWRCGEFSKI